MASRCAPSPGQRARQHDTAGRGEPTRRVLARLRERGYVGSGKGHGGGWSITCDLHKVTLRDIYEAVGSPTVFAMGNRVVHPGCLVEKVVNQSLASAFDEAEARLSARLGGVTLAELSERFNRQYTIHRGSHHAHPSPQQ